MRLLAFSEIGVVEAKLEKLVLKPTGKKIQMDALSHLGSHFISKKSKNPNWLVTDYYTAIFQLESKLGMDYAMPMKPKLRIKNGEYMVSGIVDFFKVV